MSKTSDMSCDHAEYRPGYQQATWSGFSPGESPVSTANHPLRVHAVTTLKTGGYSTGDFRQFNLATHVGDDVEAVKKNRKKLREDLNLPAEPVWLDQCHTNKVYRAGNESAEKDGDDLDNETISNAGDKKSLLLKADASITDKPGVVCAVLTADCLPVFICNKSATEVAVVHAGWRGLHQGIITNTIQAMQSPHKELLVHLGPAIGPQAFEVGEDVYTAFVEKQLVNRSAFVATRKAAGRQHFLCDIYQLARNELQVLGINNVTGGECCTYTDTLQYYSYRRLSNTGRMASLIWLQ